jgi:hypothetical protein
LRIIGKLIEDYQATYNAKCSPSTEDSIPAEAEKPFLLLALRVQKCWAEMMLYCKALRSMGVENVACVFPN